MYIHTYSFSSSPPAKVPRLEGVAGQGQGQEGKNMIVPLEELEGIRIRMVEYDEKREAVIKVGRLACIPICLSGLRLSSIHTYLPLYNRHVVMCKR